MSISLSDFNWLDYLFCSIFVVIILLSLWRGLIKEIISIAAWVIGLLVAIAFTPKLAAVLTSCSAIQSMLAHAGSKISDTTASESHLIIGFSFFVLLVGVLILGTSINYMMTKAAQAAGLGLLNRLLGGAFGCLKGFIVNLALIFYMQTTSLAQTPAWEQSQLVQAYQPAVAFVQGKIGAEFTDLDKTIKELINRGE